MSFMQFLSEQKTQRSESTVPARKNAIDLDNVKKTPKVVLKVMNDPTDKGYLGRLVNRGLPEEVEHDFQPGAPLMHVWGSGSIISKWVFDNHVWSHTAVAAYTY